MNEIGTLVEIFQSSGFRNGVKAGSIEMAEPLSPVEISRVEKQLPSTLFDSFLPLLKVTGGFELFSREASEEPYSLLSLDLRSFEPEVWQTTYPRALEISAFEEFLYWDLLGDPPGRVFFVDHDGPTHTHAFDSLADLLALLATSSENSLGDYLFKLIKGDVVEVPLMDFEPDSQELSQFLGRFPGHFSVHDLRGSSKGSHFYYNLTGPDGCARFGDRRLFVQRQPMGWFEKMKWYWSPKTVFHLEPIGEEFLPGESNS